MANVSQRDPVWGYEDKHDQPAGPGINCGFGGIIIAVIVVVVLCWIVGWKKRKQGDEREL